MEHPLCPPQRWILWETCRAHHSLLIRAWIVMLHVKMQIFVQWRCQLCPIENTFPKVMISLFCKIWPNLYLIKQLYPPFFFSADKNSPSNALWTTFTSCWFPHSRVTQQSRSHASNLKKSHVGGFVGSMEMSESTHLMGAINLSGPGRAPHGRWKPSTFHFDAQTPRQEENLVWFPCCSFFWFGFCFMVLGHMPFPNWLRDQWLQTTQSVSAVPLVDVNPACWNLILPGHYLSSR